MQVQLNTDSHIRGGEELTRRIEADVEAVLGRFGDRITRVEVQLNDVNSGKRGNNDKRCLIEVRPAGFEPIVASHHAGTLDEAIEGALEKAEKALTRAADKRSNKKGQIAFGDAP
jgi:ribosome-associated translation inhibitor RaiA